MVTLELTFCKVSLKLKKNDWLETSSIYSVDWADWTEVSVTLYTFKAMPGTGQLLTEHIDCIKPIKTVFSMLSLLWIRQKKIITFGKFIKQWMYWVLEQQTDAGESYEHNICLTLCRFWHNQITHSPRIIHSACYVSFPFATVYFPTI